jgi:hypothetical protein
VLSSFECRRQVPSFLLFHRNRSSSNVIEVVSARQCQAIASKSSDVALESRPVLCTVLCLVNAALVNLLESPDITGRSHHKSVVHFNSNLCWCQIVATGCWWIFLHRGILSGQYYNLTKQRATVLVMDSNDRTVSWQRSTLANGRCTVYTFRHDGMQSVP